jgi:hypothetical protein
MGSQQPLLSSGAGYQRRSRHSPRGLSSRSSRATATRAALSRRSSSLDGLASRVHHRLLSPCGSTLPRRSPTGGNLVGLVPPERPGRASSLATELLSAVGGRGGLPEASFLSRSLARMRGGEGGASGDGQSAGHVSRGCNTTGAAGLGEGEGSLGMGRPRKGLERNPRNPPSRARRLERKARPRRSRGYAQAAFEIRSPCLPATGTLRATG